MAKHEKFNFRTADELRAKIAALGCDVELSENTAILGKPVNIAGKTAPNAMAVLPMEGCDCLPCGGVSELFARRYLRFAAGGAGLLWWEACAVLHEARANPLQMMLTDSNASALAKLLEQTNKAAPKQPVNILQLTHSGRYSRHTGHTFTPILAQHDPYLDPRVGASESTELASDGYLESLPEHYINTAKLAQDCGFDGVDIKACHRYLLSELLAAHTRPGKYGGSFANRTRLLREIIAEVRKHTSPDFIIACRFNATDAHPNGFDEHVELAELLVQCGVQLLGVSAGNPYYTNPQVLRPFDLPGPGVPLPDEHPLENTAQLFDLTAQVQRAAGEIPVVSAGYSWLRQFAPQVAAANLVRGQSKFMGLGRQSFAYPNAPLDILTGGLEPKQCCIACSKCTQMMRDHTHAGCVMRDSEVYATIYKQGRAEACARQQS